MKVLHLLASGGTGGIEVLCKDIIEKANWDNRICFLFEEGKIYEELKKRDANVFSLKNEDRNRKKIVNKLVDYCVKEKIEIVTVHHGGANCNLIYIMLKKKLPKLKYVRYLHGCFDEYTFGNEGNFIKRTLVKFVMQKAFNISDLLIFISNAVKDSFDKKFNIKDKKTAIVYNGIDSKFLEEAKLKNEDMKNIIFVGRLTYVKGVNLLIEALKKIHEVNDNIKLTIVGEGEEKQNLINQVNELDLQNFVLFTGRQANVIKWLDKADIFVYPSIWQEGFGISVVEAMARGCIPVAFNKGGLTEIIESGKNGFLISNVNSDELAKQIIEIISMDSKMAKIIRNNAMKSAKRYTINKTLLKLKEGYNNILD